MSRWPLMPSRVLVLSSALVAVLACAHRGDRAAVDYVFAVAGVVKDAVAQPIEGVRVTLEVSTTLYEAVTPVRRQEQVTDSLGRFIFTLISHSATNPYIRRFEKGGFASQTVAAAAPPHQDHQIMLAPTEVPKASRGESAAER